MKDITDFVGQATLEKMKSTRAHMFARVIHDILYSSDVPTTKTLPDGYWRTVPKEDGGAVRFTCSSQVYVSDRVPKGEPFLCGSENLYADVRLVLHELAHELELMALKQVT